MKKNYFSFLLLFIIILVVFLSSCRNDSLLKKTTKPSMTNNEYLTMVQEAAFRYFYDLGHPISGLAYDRYPDLENGCVSGGTGMGLMAIIVGIERGFVSREHAATRVLKILNFFKNTCPQYHGAWAHFIDG
ncbi:MAG: beta-glucosidase, partial [Spirochaetes bacterium]|nr:beta-glucosidase [Spirochaetota bacterium]